jgi:hypothetical protein
MIHQGSMRFFHPLFQAAYVAHIFQMLQHLRSLLPRGSNDSFNRLTSGSLAGLALPVGLVTALVALALSLGVEAVVGVSSLVAQVGVDANELATVPGDHAAHIDLARAVAVALAVTARAVHLAVVLGIEIDDVDGAAAIVLNHFVGGVVGATTDDVGGAVALEGDGVLADVFKPDVLEVAGTVGELAFFLW